VAEEIREAQDAMHESLKTVRKEAGDQSHWRPHVLGELDGDSWLLKDEINLFVDMPGEKGSFTVVDLPGKTTICISCMTCDCCNCCSLPVSRSAVAVAAAAAAATVAAVEKFSTAWLHPMLLPLLLRGALDSRAQCPLAALLLKL
jgi:hypothetical protein